MEVEPERSKRNGAGLKISGSVIFVGHARLPHSLAPRDSSPVVSVELETDTASGEISSVGAYAVLDLESKIL